MAEAIVSIVVGRLTDLLHEEAHLLHEVSDEIQQVVTKLTWIKSFLHDADSRIDEQRVRLLLAEVRDLVYDAENVVERFLLKAVSSERQRTQGGLKIMVRRGACVCDANGYHHKFGREIKDIKTRMENISIQFRDLDIVSTVEQGQVTSSSDTSQGKLKRFYTYAVVEPDIFVGFQKNVASLVQHLVSGGDDGYPVIFICGMGGLGKTTLANKIYNHSSIKSHFEGLAWVTISRKWQPRDVLQRILVSLVPKKQEETLNLDVDKLVQNLVEIQQQKKCLIVLDDIWTGDAWDSIEAAFPSGTCGSKLLLTSRNETLAAHVNRRCLIDKPHLLNADESWELLCLKAIPKAYCLDRREFKEKEKLGRELVLNCAGLPLAIVVLGGVLVTKPTLSEWEKVYKDSLYSLQQGKGLGEDYQREILHILIWSYNALPPQLKPCFLYLGKFKEDEEIDVETLYQLWIAEGMVLSRDRSEDETMMEVAESYMGELVLKSMVQVELGDDTCEQRKFRSCWLHDSMRDMCLKIAKGEDFYEVINLQKVYDFNLYSSVELAYTRQVVVYSREGALKTIKYDPIKVKKPIKRRLRSLLYFSGETPSEFGVRYNPEYLAWNVAHFRFLRVFALEGTYFGGVSGVLFYKDPGNALRSLVHLRYLSLQFEFSCFPSMLNFELLQTLKLESIHFIAHPVFIQPWTSRNVLGMLGRVRHLSLPSGLYKGPGERKLRFDGLSKLETLDNFNTRCCEVKDLAMLNNLRKLTVHIPGSHKDVTEILKYLQDVASSSGGSTSCPLYVSLDIRDCDLKGNPHTLRQLLSSPELYSLLINGDMPELLLHNHLDCLSSNRITILTLYQSHLEADPMPLLEKLPVLRTLKLRANSFTGNKMVCSATGFPQLTHLEICHLKYLKEWRVEEGSIPNLSYLLIYTIRELEEIPEGLKFLKHLQRVDLREMRQDFDKRVKIENGLQGPDFYKIAHVPSLYCDADFIYM